MRRFKTRTNDSRQLWRMFRRMEKKTGLPPEMARGGKRGGCEVSARLSLLHQLNGQSSRGEVLLVFIKNIRVALLDDIRATRRGFV